MASRDDRRTRYRPTAFTTVPPEDDEVEAEVASDGPVIPGTRFVDRGLLGRGGMAEVRRVWDPPLRREVAMKIVRAGVGGARGLAARFVEEAQATSQLQHPGIVSVHELGVLEDGRPYFTMDVVEGRTLGDAIQEVQDASRGGRWTRTDDGWSLHRLVDALRSVCEAVAYAHARGVLHRDLKPDNVMLGRFGEVRVVDWGVAQLFVRSHVVDDGSFVVSDRAERRAGKGARREIVGTPAYMAPEQARGEAGALGPTTDVFALGAVLYEVLTGRAPFEGGSTDEQLARAAEAAPPMPTSAELGGAAEGAPGELPPAPAELVLLCAWAMAPDPLERLPDAGVFAEELRDWLEGARRRERALAVVDKARRLEREVQAREAEARTLEDQARGHLQDLPGWAPASRKRPGWELEERAELLRREASTLSVEREQALRGALLFVPDLPEAHLELARLHRRQHAAAEAAREEREALGAGLRLRAHVEVLPDSVPEKAELARYLVGTGTLTLATEPVGATVSLSRVSLREHRLQPVLEEDLGQTPLDGVGLAMGSYLLELSAPGRATVRYPVALPRSGWWSSAPPGVPGHRVRLPRAGALSAGDCLVPGGPCRVGGDAEAVDALRSSRVWVHDVVVRRTPVTNADYLAFLDDLVASGREEEAVAMAPRERAATAGAEGRPVYGRDARGRFVLVEDADGDLWQPDWPVVLVDWHQARAYAAWRAARDGLPWRLPREVEWEKAARGVDGRFHPWGDRFDPSWACMKESHAGRPMVVDVEAFPVDESPYGVRGLAGNVAEWCADAYVPGASWDPRGPPADAGDEGARVVRGGTWNADRRWVRSAARARYSPGYRAGFLGFRLARDLVAADL